MKRWLITQLGVAASSCEFLGPVPHDQVQDYMRRASVCVFPSIWENFPTVCLEAMDAGAVVVGSSRGGMAEMIEDGVNGFLGDPEEPKTFAEKIILALSDEKLSESMGQAAQQLIFEKYRPEVIIPQQLSAYHKAIEQFHRSPSS
jgi:glycosyltransferase involved in cell wall biosynthesis